MATKKSAHRITHASWVSFLLGAIFLAILHPSVEASPASQTSSNDNDDDKKGPATSLCLDPSVIQSASRSDGILDKSNPDHFARSAISTNNFINVCVGSKLTNGQQVEEGSCNPTPMGFIPSKANTPSVRIVNPTPKTVIKAHEEFNITVALSNLKAGFFTSPKNTYYLAPQVLNSQGFIQGHVHLVAQLVKPKDTILDPTKFAFFKGVADVASHGEISTAVTGGLPDGIYRISTLTSAKNHQIVSVSVAQRGAVDDAIYVTVGTGVSAADDTGTGTHNEAAAAAVVAKTATNPGTQGIGDEGKHGESSHEVEKSKSTEKTTGKSTTPRKGGGSAHNGKTGVCKPKRHRVKRDKPDKPEKPCHPKNHHS